MNKEINITITSSKKNNESNSLKFETEITSLLIHIVET